MEEFQSYRPLLFSIAYRMLGSASEAEDVVQDSYLRYRSAPPGEVRSAKAYLSTIVTRLCLDQLKSARARREQYIGPWLPEPLLTVDDPPELRTVELRESVAPAFLVLLESLTPQERAVFLLREVFEYGYDEIAAMLALSAANCRQIFHRAQRQVAERRPRFEPAPEAQRRLVERFLVACRDGDMAALTAVLAEDIVAWSDGGGKVSAARNPIRGREHVARYLLGQLQKARAGLRYELAEVNGLPAVLTFDGATLVYVATFELSGGAVHGLHSVLNPDKLAYIQRQFERRA
jgi:RNA polymerase sigma-70 factor (ECF subfamily)